MSKKKHAWQFSRQYPIYVDSGNFIEYRYVFDGDKFTYKTPEPEISYYMLEFVCDCGVTKEVRKK